MKTTKKKYTDVFEVPLQDIKNKDILLKVWSSAPTSLYSISKLTPSTYLQSEMQCLYTIRVHKSL